MFSGDANEDDVDGSYRRGGVSEGGFPLGELEPEVVHVLGARLHAPRGERLGREPRLQPLRERLRGREAVAARREEGVVEIVVFRGFRRCCVCEGHGGDFEEATREGAAGGAADVGLRGRD